MATRVALLYTRFNGMAQGFWAALRDDGLTVVRPEDLNYTPPLSSEAMCRFVQEADPDVIFCPFLKEVVPPEICQWRTTWIPHPGIRGDAGPSSLSWAVLEAQPTWGVTMVRAEPATAAEQLDAGNVGAWREFEMPTDATVAEIYAQRVTPAAIDCAREILAQMTIDPGYVGVPLAAHGSAARGCYRPVLSQQRLAFSWEDDPDSILRKIRAAPLGVRTTLDDQPVNAFDSHAHGADGSHLRPGSVIAHQDGAVLVATGGGRGIWVGHARIRRSDGGRGLKLPAVEAIRPRLAGVPERFATPDECNDSGHRVIRYKRIGDVGWIDATPYNGASSTAFCSQLLATLRYAAQQDTSAIVLAGGRTAWNNGIHLGVIEAAVDPLAEAWANIQRIDDVAEMVFGLSRGQHGRPQTTVAVLGASAGAGGAVLSACFDHVLARRSIIFNYHYAGMGLSGSELRSLVLPMRAGDEEAKRLLTECLPTSPAAAQSLGLVDEIGPDDPDHFRQWALDRATVIASMPRVPPPAIDTRPFRTLELADMHRDIFKDRYGFRAHRRQFLGLPI